MIRMKTAVNLILGLLVVSIIVVICGVVLLSLAFAPKIWVSEERTGGLTISGADFDTGGEIEITYEGVPNRRGPVKASRLVGAGTGEFIFRDRVTPTSDDPADAAKTVVITATNLRSKEVATTTASGKPWVRPQK